jgi:hypothetical protein
MTEPAEETVQQWIERAEDAIDREIRRAMKGLWRNGLITLTPLESGHMLAGLTSWKTGRRNSPRSGIAPGPPGNTVTQQERTLVMCAETNLPVIFDNDVDDEFSDRLLQGGRAKWVDKVWTMDGTPPREEDRFLVTGTGFALQRWVDGLPEVILKEPGKSLPDPDLLNEAIPREEWPIGKFSGQPEPPWKPVAFAYLLRLRDAARFTHINSTYGTRACVRSIRDRMRDMGALRGASVFPVVQLTSAPMPSKKYPGRFRPEFEPIEWRQISSNKPAQIEHQQDAKLAAPEQIGEPVKEPTTGEVLDDKIPSEGGKSSKKAA